MLLSDKAPILVCFQEVLQMDSNRVLVLLGSSRHHHNQSNANSPSFLLTESPFIMSTLIIALGTAAANGTSIRAATKEEWTQKRQSVAKESLDSLQVVVVASELETLYDPMELAGWVPLLRQNASVMFTVQAPDGADLQPLHTSLLLAGLKASSEQRNSEGERILVAQRKDVTSTTSQPIALGDLMDEDDLLQDTTLGQPSMEPTKTAEDDCAGRTPCDNCTCGRAEGEPKKKLTKEEIIQKSSSCGNCAKGDAFRCASCPFLGQPAFKPGEEHLILDLTDDL
jgi:hypothetical protein